MLPSCGSVLGIDVGYSHRRKTTGIARLWWDAKTINWTCRNCGSDEFERQQSIDTLCGKQYHHPLAVAIDGPLRPRLEEESSYRAAESLLSCGVFQHRGKPGPTNGGSGPSLHRAATELAKLTCRLLSVAPALDQQAICGHAIIEAFPNLFLGVLCDDQKYPSISTIHRRWTDKLFPMVRHKLTRLLADMLPGRRVDGNLELNDHEEIAALVCALTALCAAGCRGVIVGSPRDGWITLPPRYLWGSDGSGRKWAEHQLQHNLNNSRVQRAFPDADFSDLGRPTAGGS